MSVLVTIKVTGDVAKFKQLMESDPDRFRRIGEAGKEAGAIHHQFGVGDGYVLVIDEWNTAEAFQTFFQNPDIAAIMVDAGAQSEPEITFAEAIDSPDRF
jgi:hypothetical protein